MASYFLHISAAFFTLSFYTQLCKRVFTAALLLFFSLTIWLPHFAQAEVIDRIAAVVNSDIITMSELQKEANAQYRAAVKREGSADRREIEEKTLDSIIDRRLLEQKGDELGISVSEMDIDAAFAENVAQSGVSEEIFLQKMHEAGVSEEEYRNTIRAGILQGKLLSADVRQKIVVTDEMVEEYYRNSYNAGSKTDARQFYTLLQIGCSWGENSKSGRGREAALAMAQKARTAVIAVEDFAKTARSYSDLPSAVDGGALGALALGDMAAAMAAAVGGLQPGYVSEIIELSESFQFFFVVSVGADNTQNSPETAAIKEEIRETLYQQQLKNVYEEWVRSLKEGAYIRRVYGRQQVE